MYIIYVYYFTYILTTRSIAMSLAKELNGGEDDIENPQPANVENKLMSVIGEILSLLIEGLVIIFLII